jgi:hypothetical protein
MTQRLDRADSQVLQGVTSENSALGTIDIFGPALRAGMVQTLAAGVGCRLLAIQNSLA